MLYWLSTAMFPQFLITLDEKSQEQAVTVRVGQAVNTVGLAGTRMGISGVGSLLVLDLYTSFIHVISHNASSSLTLTLLSHLPLWVHPAS